MNKQFSFKASIYTVTLKLEPAENNQQQVVIDAHSEHYHKNFHGKFKDADLPDLYFDLYGGCNTLLETISEWLDSHQPIELTDTGNLVFTYEVHLGKKGPAKRKLEFQLKQCEVSEVERLHMTIKELQAELEKMEYNEKISKDLEMQTEVVENQKRQIEQLSMQATKMEEENGSLQLQVKKLQELTSSLQNQSEQLKEQIKELKQQEKRISPIIDSKHGFSGLYSLHNGAISCSMKTGRWMPICLTQPIIGNMVFDVECLQTPMNAMFGLVSQDDRNIEDCHMKTGNFFLHVKQQSMHRYTDEGGSQLADLLLRAGDRIRVRVNLSEMWIRWYLVRNSSIEEILKVSIHERLKDSNLYPCLMIDWTNEKYRFM